MKEFNVLSAFSQCQDWTPWSTALQVRPIAGQYIVEYIFFIIFSVCPYPYHSRNRARFDPGFLCHMCKRSCKRLCNLC